MWYNKQSTSLHYSQINFAITLYMTTVQYMYIIVPVQQGCPLRGSRAKFGSLHKKIWLFEGKIFCIEFGSLAIARVLDNLRGGNLYCTMINTFYYMYWE